MHKISNVVRSSFLTIFVLFFVVGCGDDSSTTTSPEVAVTKPMVTTIDVSAITDSTAVCGGTVTSDGGAEITARGICWSTNVSPTISDHITNDGEGTGSYTSSITGLTLGTRYFAKAYATNSAGTSYGIVVAFRTNGPVTDIDGNVYQTVKIGSLVWMAENLRVTHYRNGDVIPDPVDHLPYVPWDSLSTGACCAYNNNMSLVSTWGYLYNWYAVNDSRNIAPEGWRVPSDEDWKKLEMYLGMSQAAADSAGSRGTDEGGKMKEEGYTHWAPPNTGATNESGFTALAGGCRWSSDSFSGLGYVGIFWSSTGNGDYAWSRELQSYDSCVFRGSEHPQRGFSVRCVMDY